VRSFAREPWLNFAPEGHEAHQNGSAAMRNARDVQYRLYGERNADRKCKPELAQLEKENGAFFSLGLRRLRSH
jgi:hypothetical protein